MTINMITGLIGIAMFVGFVGFLIVWVPAPPLIVIVVGVTAVVIWDFIKQLRVAADDSER